MKKSILLLAALVIAGLLHQSCKKYYESDEVLIETAEDLSVLEDYTEQLDADINMVVEERGGGNECPTITFTEPEGTWPNTITIDFGTQCVRPDGRVLSGKLIMVQNKEFGAEGIIRRTTFDNFYVDGIRVDGMRTWSHTGSDINGNRIYKMTAEEMKLTFEDDSNINWYSERTNTLIEGGNTAMLSDDVWSIEGDASGTTRKSVEFAVTITTPLIKRISCRWISSGEIDFTTHARTRTLDFGDGACDRLATLTLATGDTRTITLRR